MINKVLNKFIEPSKQIPAERKRFSNRALLALILPIVVEQFLGFLVGIADTFMVSYAGEDAVSGVALITQLDNVFIIIFAALATGGSVVISQYIGIRNKERACRASGQLFVIEVLTAIVITTFILTCGRWLFDLLFKGVDSGVRTSGIRYLMICASSFLFLGLYNTGAGIFRSMGRTRTVMYVSLIMNGINITGNAIGIFVLHAGVAGVAVPSLISRIFAAVAMIFLVRKKGGFISISASDIFRLDGAMIRKIFRIAIPGSLENGLFMLSKLLISTIVAAFGTVQIAAYGVSQSFWSMSAMFCLAMGSAFITVIGQYMGAGDVEGAEYYMKKMLRLTFIGGIGWNFFFYGVTALMMLFYDLSPETVHYVLILVLIHNLFNGLFCPVSFSLTNGLRAAGDVKFGMYATIISSVVARLLLSILFGSILGWGVIGAAIAMVFDWLIKAVLIYFRYRSGKWKSIKVI